MAGPDIAKLIDRGVRAHRAGRFQDALTSYRKALRKQPGDAEALSLSGLALLHSGRLADAEGPLRRAVAAEPEQTGFRLNLIEFLLAAERFDQALMEAERVTAADPHAARAWEQSGDAASALGDPVRAARDYREAAALQPRHLSGVVKLARADLAAGDLDAAGRALERAVSLGAEHDSVLRLRLELLGARGDWAGLEADARRRLDDAPDDTAGWHALSHSLFEQGLYRQSMDAYRRVLALTPENGATYTAFARICMHAQELGAADEALERAARLSPESPETLAARGMMATYLGRLSEAEAYTRQCLERDPSYAPAYTQLAELTRGRLSDREMLTLAELSESERAPVEHRITSAFALASGHDARGELDAAFDAYRLANDLGCRRNERDGVGYDPARVEARVERIMSLFPGPRATPTTAPEGSQPIFIVGMPRSGTTLLESVLSAHSRVTAGGERMMMQQILASYLELATTRTADPEPATLAQWASSYLSELPDGRPDRWVTDKQPLNFEAIGLIAWLFPGAPIVHIRRDPMETCLSIFCHEFTKLWTFAHRLEDIGHYYGQYARLVDHWERTLGSRRFLTLQYEDFAGDLDRVTPGLLSWCGLDWEAQCTSPQSAERPIATMSAVQARQPVTIRIGKASRYRSHLDPLVDALRGSNVDLTTGALVSTT